MVRLNSRRPLAPLWLVVFVYCAFGQSAVAQTDPGAEVMPSEVRQALLLGDTSRAVAWLTKAVASGDSAAAYELGKLYRLGNGVPKNRAKALEMFELASAAGHGGAGDILVQLKPSDTSAKGLATRPDDSRGNDSTEDWFAWINAGRAPVQSTAVGSYEIKNAVGTPLVVHVVDRGHEAWLYHLLAQKVDLAVADVRGNGVLHCAVRSQDPLLLDALLAAGAQTKLKNAEGATALHLATALGNKVAVKQLLQAGSNMNVKNNSGWSAVMIAERSGNSELLSLFGRKSTKSKTRKTAATPMSGKSLLHVVRQGKLSRVKRLLNAGISGDSKNSGGDTALTLAVSRKHSDIVAALLAHGADVNLADGRGATPLHLAVYNGDEAAMRLLLNAKADTNLRNAAQNTPAQVAVKRQCIGCLVLLIDAEADLEAADRNGMTPLLEAAKIGQKSLVETLLYAGGDFFAVDNANRTPLWWAVKNHNLEVAFTLLNHSLKKTSSNHATATHADLGGVAPLHLAVQHGDVELVRRLAVAEAINTPTQTGSSPLLLAASAGNNSVVELLLALGAEVDRPNNLGGTPLMEAIQQRNHSTALLLVQAGASLNQHNLSGLSAKRMIKAIDEPQWTAVLDEEQGVLAAIFKSLSE